MQLHPSYECKCQNPRPKIHNGEDCGLCDICNMVYDINLYEMRLRQHVSNWNFETIDEFLREVDPRYRQLVSA